ncbi:hypothetical protein NL676_015916 [Syzygium grande]|nr:hypothetical protein NL676_015916 [Syzygium grande]
MVNALWTYRATANQIGRFPIFKLTLIFYITARGDKTVDVHAAAVPQWRAKGRLNYLFGPPEPKIGLRRGREERLDRRLSLPSASMETC